MSNYKTVFYTLGILQIILGFFMFVPIIAQLLLDQFTSAFLFARYDQNFIDFGKCA